MNVTVYAIGVLAILVAACVAVELLTRRRARKEAERQKLAVWLQQVAEKEQQA